jgi:uncharacterized protein YabE (DUF348 family)
MKNLFSKSLSKKKLTVMVASLIVFSAAAGFMIYETSKKTVAVSMNGQDKVIKTHADTVQDIFDDLEISLRSEDYLFPSGSTKVKDGLEVVWEPAKQVQLTDSSGKKTIWTTADTVGGLLKEQNIALSEHDKVNPKPEEEIKDDLKIEVEKAFALTLIEGGKKQQMWSTSTTVADFLSQQGITLNNMDRVEPKLEETVKENAIVNVIRVEKVTDVVEEPISYAVVTKKDASLAKGKEKVVSHGQEGLLSRQYEVVLENGKETSRKLLSEKRVKEKKDKIVAVGTKVMAQTVAVSRGAGSSESGREMYVSSTAYTPSCSGCSGITATGINLKSNPGIKVIAVDPRVIPLGTKVYVEGYGYAVAADTGSAIKGNKIDVFFASKSDAYRWGRKTVKIKILD